MCQPSQNVLVLGMDVIAPGAEVRLPLGSSLPLAGQVNVTVYWGDSNMQDLTSGHVAYDSSQATYYFSHAYASVGEYVITVDRRGPGPVWLPAFGWNLGPTYPGWKWNANTRLLNISSFGELGTTSLRGCLAGVSTNVPVPADIPRTVTELSGAFYRAGAFNQSINTWNVSNVQYMDNMFQEAVSFNQPLDLWETRSVIRMNSMFYQASAFNQPVNTWRTDSLTQLTYAFYMANSFNQPLDAWNVSRVTQMFYTFAYTANFNQDISRWDVSRVSNFEGFLYGNSVFNQPLDPWRPLSATNMANMFTSTRYNLPLGSWNVSNVVNFNGMFQQNPVFNQPLGSWNTRSAQFMQNMFYGSSAFDQPLGSWNTSSVTDMRGMFGATGYNQPIQSWNVAAVTRFDGMFTGNVKFNQPLNGWNVKSGTAFSGMFDGCTVFNQPLDSWNTSAAANMDNMFRNTALFNQVLTSWCVPRISSRPTGFADSSALSAQREPIWGTCPQPPVAAPVVGCAGPAPAGNVSCINDRWIIYENSTLLSSGNSSVVTIQPNTTIVIADPVVAKNVTIVISVPGTNISSSGTIQIDNCVTLGGAVVIRLSDGTLVTNNDRIPIIVSNRPDCFDVNVTATIETQDAAPCAPIVTGTPSVDSQSTSASLVVVFSVEKSNSDPACSESGPENNSAQVPAALIGGIIGGIVGLALLIASISIYIKRRQLARETARVKKQVEMGQTEMQR